MVPTEIRPITPADDAAIAAIIRASLRAVHLDVPGTAFSDPGLDHLSAYYAHPGRHYDVLLEDGAVIGGVGLAAFADLPGCCELQKLYLTEAVRGRGLGRMLLRHIERCAAEMGFRRVYLETHSALTAAIHLYERSGYREIARPASVIHSTMDRFYLRELNENGEETSV